jgi:hypothetical protein
VPFLGLIVDWNCAEDVSRCFKHPNNICFIYQLQNLGLHGKELSLRLAAYHFFTSVLLNTLQQKLYILSSIRQNYWIPEKILMKLTCLEYCTLPLWRLLLYFRIFLVFIYLLGDRKTRIEYFWAAPLFEFFAEDNVLLKYFAFCLKLRPLSA